MSANTFDAKATLTVGDRSYEIFRLDALQVAYDLARLRFSLKILLENLLRRGRRSDPRQGHRGAREVEWNGEPSEEIAFTPARVVMQDFTGIPAVVDLAAMRDAISEMGGDPSKINPLVPAELVIDHSVQVDVFGTAQGVRTQRRARVRAQPGQERYAGSATTRSPGGSAFARAGALSKRPNRKSRSLERAENLFRIGLRASAQTCASPPSKPTIIRSRPGRRDGHQPHRSRRHACRRRTRWRRTALDNHSLRSSLIRHR